MATGFSVTRTTGTLAGRAVFGVRVICGEGTGDAERVRIECPRLDEQNRIAGQLTELPNRLSPNS